MISFFELLSLKQINNFNDFIMFEKRINETAK